MHYTPTGNGKWVNINVSTFQLQTEVLLPTKTEVHSIFGKGGLLNRYDKYRYMFLTSYYKSIKIQSSTQKNV